MRGAAAVLSFLLFLGLSTLPVGAATVRITGSTTVFPLAQTAAEVFMEQNAGVQIEVTGNGSSEGIKAVIDGTAEIGNASRDAKTKEIEAAKAKGIDLTRHVVALDCIVPVVHPSNPVAQLTVDQLTGIFTGKIRSWSEVGGGPEPIVVVSRDTQSGTYEVWHKLVLHDGEQRSDAVIQDSNGGVAELVASKKNAIGYVGIGYLSPMMKGLKVNGIEATEATAQNESYPIARKLFMFTKGTPTGAVKQFIDFIVGPDGAAIAQDEGFVPVVSRLAAK